MGKIEKEIDLAEELANATEQANIEEAEDFHEEESLEDHADFEDFEPFDDADEEIIDDDEPTFTANPKITAKRWIRAFNALQKTLLKPLYKKNILKEGDEEKAKKWARIHRDNPTAKIEDVIDGDVDVRDRLDKYVEALEDLPFSKEDMQDIAEPLAEVIEKHKRLQMSPEIALLLAVVIVMLPRLEPIFPSITSLFKKATKTE